MELTFLITSLLIIGLHVITRKGAALGFVEKFWVNIYTQLYPKVWMQRLAKPLTECPTCMSSVWGFGGFMFTSLEWYWLPVWCVCLAGFINLLTSIAWRE